MYPTEKSPKIAAKFICECCNYKCSKQSEYNKHLLTSKHKKLESPVKWKTSENIVPKYIQCLFKNYLKNEELVEMEV